jgi:hypothetical protein
MAAATAMVIAVANPAAADQLPASTTVTAQGTGDFIDIGSLRIELEPDPTDPCGDNDPTLLTATVGAEVNDVAPISNVQATFDAGDVPGTGLCATIVIENTPGGTQTQTGVGTGTVALNNPSPNIRVDIDNGCAIDPPAFALNGTITGTDPWDLELGASGFTIPAVATSGTCNFIEAALINGALGLPTSTTDASLTFDVNTP